MHARGDDHAAVAHQGGVGNVIDVDELLKPISDDLPCGEDLEYDDEFGELERIAQPKEEQQIGDTIVAAEEPDWREMYKRATALFSRTKDLRVTLYMLRGAVHEDGFVGLCACLQVLHSLIAERWDSVHPLLDPDDDNDPTMRVNIVAGLCDKASVLDAVRKAPLVSSRALGRFSLRDMKIASGEITPTGDEASPEMAAIEGAFMEAPAEEVQATQTALQQSIDAVVAIESSLTEKVGAANATDLNGLVSLLRECVNTVNEQLSRRGLGDPSLTAEAGADAEEGFAAAAGGAAPVARAGEISSREDVVRVLDKLCDWYARAEPSSPVPVLLRRAKRLVHMDFMDIVRDLAPDGLAQVEKFRGEEGSE